MEIYWFEVGTRPTTQENCSLHARIPNLCWRHLKYMKKKKAGYWRLAAAQIWESKNQNLNSSRLWEPVFCLQSNSQAVGPKLLQLFNTMPTSNYLGILKALYSHTFVRWLCNLTKSSKIRSEGLACQQLTSEHNSTCTQREWEEGIQKMGAIAYCNWKANVAKSRLDLRRRA
jgi:hypothetical protein